MIKLEKLNSIYLDDVLLLKVSAEQLKYVGKIANILDKVDSKVHPYIIKSNDKIVGFFLIDTTYSLDYGFADAGSLGLRAYFIGSKFQGKGYGKKAVKLLPKYLKENYPNYSKIYLTVNCKNKSAKHCYADAGFIDTNELCHGGDAGPQYIMKIELY